MEEIYLTKEGKEEKIRRLEYLKSIRRLEVAEAIKAAREYGDLSENSEYDAARHEQALLEEEIELLEETLRVAKIVDPSKRRGGTIGIGSKVTVYDAEFDEEIVYTLVGSLESDPMKNIISNESPIGAQMMGKKAGDSITAKTPAGTTTLKIVKVE